MLPRGCQSTGEIWGDWQELERLGSSKAVQLLGMGRELSGSARVVYVKMGCPFWFRAINYPYISRSLINLDQEDV